jgi:hypothetical protein
MQDMLKKILIKPLSHIIYKYYFRQPLIVTLSKEFISAILSSSTNNIRFIIEYDNFAHLTFKMGYLWKTLKRIAKKDFFMSFNTTTNDFCKINISDIKKNLKEIDILSIDYFELEFSEKYILFRFEKKEFKYNISWENISCPYKKFWDED